MLMESKKNEAVWIFHKLIKVNNLCKKMA